MEMIPSHAMILLKSTNYIILFIEFEIIRLIDSVKQMLLIKCFIYQS